MKYPCYGLAHGRQVIANYKAQGKFLKSVPQPENRSTVNESPEIELDEILRMLSKQLSVAKAEELKNTGMTDDQVEGLFAIALHSELNDFPPQTLADPDFWRYVAVEFFRDFIFWRDGENCSQASFGLNGMRRIPDCVPLRMFNRAHIANRIINNGSTLKLEDICLAGGTDFWQSHVFRAYHRFDLKIVEELILASMKTQNDVVREVAKTVKQFRANYDFHFRQEKHVEEMFKLGIDSGKKIVELKKKERVLPRGG
jgi:hypothetical protein